MLLKFMKKIALKDIFDLHAKLAPIIILSNVCCAHDNQTDHKGCNSWFNFSHPSFIAYE